ncbi:N-acetylmuramic acid 6-phosphate etherase [Bacillus mangrovi]|uniref:N-acetylmuramic acid 6-phosphate etherase n=1 Tax=Metabacillus mangrovi TaxID=1491830 RepID=A0A7X2S120_9BACI|nr:N-acetylmuramic acid 6-phosphate etherase [Metabacillus mangrovi]MTH51918.1 N-acetylmuramic acid 6-phosphate etherase [Metabacillus mangrovi]
MEKQLKRLTTEQRNEKSRNLDTAETIDILTIMNEEDKKAAEAVEKALPQISRAVEFAAGSFQKGGRLIYIGAGTSGRLGILDAVECPPTFSTSPEQVQAVMAGGNDAFIRAAEGAEDSTEEGEKDLQKLGLSSKDTVIGIASSGRTPYVAGALQYARRIGADTVALSSNEGAYISGLADCAIETVTGPEVLTGSTRLKAATAHKMVLNMISTAAMVKSGKVYENLMVDVHVSNHKLKERAVSIIEEITNATAERARAALEEADLQVKRAIVMIQANKDAEQAKVLLESCGGNVKEAVTAAEEEKRS